MSRCNHETVQIAQDGSQIIVCGTCGREFGHVGDDQAETFHAYVSPEHPLIVLGKREDEEPLAPGIGFIYGEGGMAFGEVQPCARCGWAMSCPALLGEDCHS